MYIQLIVIVTPDGGIIGSSVDVHCMRQRVIASTSLNHLHFQHILFMAHTKSVLYPDTTCTADGGSVTVSQWLTQTSVVLPGPN